MGVESGRAQYTKPLGSVITRESRGLGYFWKLPLGSKDPKLCLKLSPIPINLKTCLGGKLQLSLILCLHSSYKPKVDFKTVS